MEAVKSKDMALELMGARNSRQVRSILEREGYLDKKYWTPLGARLYIERYGNHIYVKDDSIWGGSNAALVEGQQTDPVNALVELIKNSEDSVLEKLMVENEFPLEGPDAPIMQHQAAELLGNRIKDNQVALVIENSEDERENNIIVMDRGKGIVCDNFWDSVCGLMRSEKAKYLWQSGKWGAGSTGSLVFCDWKMIVSKPSSGDNRWGWTIIRKIKEQEHVRGTYAYFTPENEQQVARFEADSLPIFWKRTNDMNRVSGTHVPYATWVKMWNYKGISKETHETKSATIRKLFCFLPVAHVPYKIIGTRKADIYKDGNKKRMRVHNGYGNLQRLRDPKNSDKVEKIVRTTSTDKDVGFEIFVLKEGVPAASWKNANMAVFVLVDGRTHFYRGEVFYSSFGINLGLIRKSLVSFVHIRREKAEREEMFKSDRETMKPGAQRRIMEALADVIKDSEEIKEIHDRRMNKILEGKENKTLNSMLDHFDFKQGSSPPSPPPPRPLPEPLLLPPYASQFIYVRKPHVMNDELRMRKKGSVSIPFQVEADKDYLISTRGRIVIDKGGELLPSGEKGFVELREGIVTSRMNERGRMTVRIRDMEELGVGRNIMLRLSLWNKKNGKEKEQVGEYFYADIKRETKPLPRRSGPPKVIWFRENGHGEYIDDAGNVLDNVTESVAVHIEKTNVSSIVYLNSENEWLKHDLDKHRDANVRDYWASVMTVIGMTIKENKAIEEREEEEQEVFFREIMGDLAKHAFSLGKIESFHKEAKQK